ncbi:excisionase family DNA binding protein [Rhodococcus sp. LBL1]|nr:excisionase family DNA binding protein [Rhodococcus sp. LBL1]MDH6685024.1 excisionase family DNA binding protein [Rhodococcus sp. LBL2]
MTSTRDLELAYHRAARDFHTAKVRELESSERAAVGSRQTTAPDRGEVGRPVRLLTAAEAGELLGINATTVREMWNIGELKCVHIGRGRKVSSLEIDRYIDERERFDPAP